MKKMCSDDNSIQSLYNFIILSYYKINMSIFVYMPDRYCITDFSKEAYK